MGRLKTHSLISWFIALCLIQFSYGYIQNLKVVGDSRQQFFIENFGFKIGGQFEMTVKDFKVLPKGAKADDPGIPAEQYTNKIFFLQRITQTDSSEYLDDFRCSDKDNQVLNKEQIPNENWQTAEGKYSKPIEEEGLYNLYFINCEHNQYHVSFELHLEEYNIGPGGKDYLPIGLSPIPTIYATFSVAYVGLFVVWVFHYMRGKGNVLNKVHYMMTVLVVLKFLSMLFYSIEQHYVKIDGKPGGWQIAYYIFAILKTSFFFVIVTLIGTGWTFFKPFLSDKDKKIIMVVIPLQILDNIALVIVGVDAPGSQGLFTWKDIFRLVDIICCGAILIPIIWSIKHLREASQSDGKAARNLQKLRLFRQFYLIVVSYIYFTRIIVYLLDATLQYYLAWLGDVFTELATLIFFVVVGYKFRPVPNNPYFNLEEEDAVRMEELRTNAETDL